MPIGGSLNPEKTVIVEDRYMTGLIKEKDCSLDS